MMMLTMLQCEVIDEKENGINSRTGHLGCHNLSQISLPTCLGLWARANLISTSTSFPLE